MKHLLLCILLFSCSKKKEVEPTFIDSSIKVKADLYRSSSLKSWTHSKCDSLGFTALCKLAGSCQEADLFQAEENGRWYRSPEKNCYDLGESKSDISKDMFVMLFPYLQATENKGAMKRIRGYAVSHNFVMGRGELSRTLITPSMLWMLNSMIDGSPYVAQVQEEKLIKEGFEKHLDAIWILNKSFLKEGISQSDYEVLRTLAEDHPRNALFQALKSKFSDGNQEKAIAILLDERLFPSDRLPTARDRCEEYLWQRDEQPKDWEGCDSDTQHDGLDYIFAAWVAGQL